MQRALRAFSPGFRVKRATYPYPSAVFEPSTDSTGRRAWSAELCFHQPTKAHFHVAKLTLYYTKWMLDLGPCLSFAVLDLALGLVENAAFIEPGIRAAPRRDLPDDLTIFMLFTLLDTCVSSVCIHRCYRWCRIDPTARLGLPHKCSAQSKAC